MQVFDLEAQGLRALNSTLHTLNGQSNETAWEIVNPKGSHAIAVGVDAPLDITVRGSTGYYCAGMNKLATIRVKGSAGPGVAENMMSGTVIIDGDASQYAGATGRGGLLVIKGNASSRCGISMKGIDIVVHGNIGHMSAFMAQSGSMGVLGDAGDALGDSLYEAVIYVRGKIASLGADAQLEPMTDSDLASVTELLAAAGLAHDPAQFRRVASARSLYHWNSDADQEY